MYSAVAGYYANRARTTQQCQAARTSAQGECAYTGCMTWGHINGQHHMLGIDRSQCHRPREVEVHGSAATGTSPSPRRSRYAAAMRYFGAASVTLTFKSAGHTSQPVCARPSVVRTDNTQQDKGKGIICSARVDLYMPTEVQGGDGLCSIGDVPHVKAGTAHGLTAKGLCLRALLSSSNRSPTSTAPRGKLNNSSQGYVSGHLPAGHRHRGGAAESNVL